MGYNTALDLAESFDLDQAILIHLQGNHYPPVPASMVQPCIDAIDAYYDEDYDKMIVVYLKAYLMEGQRSITCLSNHRSASPRSVAT
jgi:hypothetical protein